MNGAREDGSLVEYEIIPFVDGLMPPQGLQPLVNIHVIASLSAAHATAYIIGHAGKGLAQFSSSPHCTSSVHGILSFAVDVVSDTTLITKPIDLVTWRIPFEQAVIGDPNLNGIIVCPALVYGRTASILAGLFRSASEGKVAWYGTPRRRYCLVHGDDLADLYVRAVEKAQVLGGQIFDAANDFKESVDELLQRLTEISGAQSPYEYIPPSTLFETAICITVLYRPYLARALLGWTPRKPGLADGLEIYYASWSASR
ncbi:hypothetical protein BDN71DRAFT_1574738 [Pleurotus eryngii]|uniref:Mug135-like C-terminal domain-containing protein n=1 Tax=Pleurotus eryngii TaxID=5323 RepID=A0A9P5ZVC3_PLEER|nr:hypothetical protein BDN71DRAFT_1574738 [Pleurotus eryngii]